MNKTWILVASFVALPALAHGQWPRYEMSGVPHRADKTVDLDSPVPRAGDGKPDLSGVWDVVPCIQCPAERGRGETGTGGTGFGPPPAPATGQAVQQQRASMANIGGGLPGATAPYQPWAADLVKKRMADNSKDNPDALCLPMGVAQLNGHPFPRKIIQTPKELVLIYEGSGTTVREVFVDGRALPRKEDVEPWWNGYSVGRWDGDTLVVETTGLMDGGWLDVRGSPITNAGRIVERFRRVKFGYMELEETIDDPSVYTKPFTAKLYWRLNPGLQLTEFVCIDKDAAHYVSGTSPK